MSRAIMANLDVWLLLASLTLTNAVPFSIKFGGQAWGMAKSVDQGATWTPIATVDMHTYQQVGMVGEVRGDAQEGMMIKFQPLHTSLARDLGYQCPKMHEKCDGTCTFDPSRNYQCFNWDHARIFIHELTIDGQKQDFSSLSTMQSNGWDFQCRSSSCNEPAVTVIDFGNGQKMVRQDGANFYYTYTFTGIEKCYDTPSWSDGYNGCESYAEKDLCSNYGHNGANDHCCTCGGGRSEPNTDPYAWRGDWSGNCPVGFNQIRTKGECETAARFFSQSDTSASRWPYPHSTIPSGCWVYLNVLYFNNDPNQWNWSGNNGHIKVFCKSDATAEPTALPTISPTLNPTFEPTSSPSRSPSLSPTANPSKYPTAEDFIIKVTGFHGQPKSVLDASKLQSEGQSDVEIEMYGFERSLNLVGRRLLRNKEGQCHSFVVDYAGSDSKIQMISGKYTMRTDCKISEGGAFFGGVDYSVCFEGPDSFLIWNTGLGWEIGRKELRDPMYAGMGNEKQWERYARTYSGTLDQMPAEGLTTEALQTSTFFDGFGRVIPGLTSNEDPACNLDESDLAIYSWKGDLSGSCAVGYNPIRTKAECETAARFFSQSDTSASPWPYPHSSIPSGCWVYLNRLYFNNDPNQWNWSGFNGHIKVFCKSDVTAEPTASPTISPTFNPTAKPTLNPTTSPTLNPSFSPSQSPSFSPTANPSKYPTAEDFVIKVKGFHGQPKSVLDASKLQSESQSDVGIEMYGFEQKLVPVGRRLLKQKN